MRKTRIEECVCEIIRDEIRKGRLDKGNDVLNALPGLLDTVYVDKKQLRTAVENCLDSNNPFNAILSLFGVQIIKKEKTIRNLMNSAEDNDGDVTVNIDDSYAKQWLTVNPSEVKTVVEDISEKLYQIENEATANCDDEKKRSSDLFDKYEKLNKEHNLLKSDKENSDKMIAERVQYMLSVNGEQATAENEQLIELLKDMSIEVFWNADNAPYAAAAMFTEYKMENENLNTKPCLIRNNEVYVKGIKFISAV